jgi:hypothetical protein
LRKQSRFHLIPVFTRDSVSVRPGNFFNQRGDFFSSRFLFKLFEAKAAFPLRSIPLTTFSHTYGVTLSSLVAASTAPKSLEQYALDESFDLGRRLGFASGAACSCAP